MDYRLEQLRFELREDPSSRIFFKLGEHLRRAGELGESIEVLRTGLQQHPRYVAAWVSLGRAQLDNGDAEGAQASLERALQLDPENAVAARAMGEAAIVNAAWVTAVKALKRARGLTPQDDALDERIAFVEARLAELGLLETAASTTREQPAVEVGNESSQPSAGEPFTVRSGGDTGQWNEADDVFAAGWVEEAAPEAPHTTEVDGGPEAVPEVAAEEGDQYPPPPPLTEDDVASMVDVGERATEAEPAVTVHEEEYPPPEEFPAVEPTAEELAVAPQSEPFVETVPLPVPEPVHALEPEPEPEIEIEPEPVFEPEWVPGAMPEPEMEPEALPETWPDPDAEPDLDIERGSDGLPLPTMTLARLAIDQGDLDLAERTLRGVIERQPEHSEAEELLKTVIAGPPDGGASMPSRNSTEAKAEALQRWLDAVRLASERLKT